MSVAVTEAPRKKRKHKPYSLLSAQAKKTKNAANRRRVARKRQMVNAPTMRPSAPPGAHMDQCL